MKKKLSILLASALIISSTATSFGASFADINDVPWAGAETYINAASSLGLMAGEKSNGQTIFRANDTVSLCETAQMVYNLLKETENATVSDDVVSKWTEVISDSSVPSWAYTAVAYCLENSIVSTSSVSGFMDKDGESKEASREEVAVMLGKALCLVDSSLSPGSKATTFKDNTKISSSAVEYITLLSDKHILSGDDNGNFNPKKTINRAEMAVLITKSYTVIEQRAAKVFPAEGTAHAFVSEISGCDGSVTVTFFNGMPSEKYTIDSTVPVSYEDGIAASYTDIAKGQLLTISYNGDCITKVVIGENATGDLLTSGLICDVSYEKNEIKIHNCKRYYDFIMNDGMNITLDGEDIDVGELIDALEDTYDDFDEDFEVILYADITMDDDNNVTDIEVTTMREAMGSISNITKNEIGLDSDDVEQYRFKDTSVNVILDNTVVGIDDLIDVVEKGKEVTAEIILDNDDYVIEIQAVTSDYTYKGTILYVTANKIMLTDGRYYYFDADYVNDVWVQLNHGTTIDDLINTVNYGDKIYVELTIDSHDYVTEILDLTGFEKTISNITKSKIELSDGSYYNFDVAADVHVIFEDAADLDVYDADVDDLIDEVNDGHKIYVYITRDSEGLEIEATNWGPAQLKFLHLERESEKHGN